MSCIKSFLQTSFGASWVDVKLAIWNLIPSLNRFLWRLCLVVKEDNVDLLGQLRHRGEDEGERGDDHHCHRGERTNLEKRMTKSRWLLNPFVYLISFVAHNSQQNPKKKNFFKVFSVRICPNYPFACGTKNTRHFIVSGDKWNLTEIINTGANISYLFHWQLRGHLWSWGLCGIFEVGKLNLRLIIRLETVPTLNKISSQINSPLNVKICHLPANIFVFFKQTSLGCIYAVCKYVILCFLDALASLRPVLEID